MRSAGHMTIIWLGESDTPWSNFQPCDCCIATLSSYPTSIVTHTWTSGARLSWTAGHHATVWVLYPREPERQPYIAGAYSTAGGAAWKASWHASLFLGLLHTFTWLHSTTLLFNSLITINQYSISPWHQCSKPIPANSLVRGPCQLFYMLLATARGYCEFTVCRWTHGSYTSVILLVHCTLSTYPTMHVHVVGWWSAAYNNIRQLSDWVEIMMIWTN